MSRINIFIETNLKGPKRRDGRYIYMLQYVNDKGLTAEKWIGGTMKCCTENMIVLQAMIEAFEHLNKKGLLVHVFTDNPHILNAWRNGWVIQWKKNGWMRSDGSIPANVDQWSRLVELMQDHYITLDEGRLHEFKSWLHVEVERADFDDKYLKNTKRGE